MTNAGQDLAGAALAGVEKFVGDAGKAILKNAPAGAGAAKILGKGALAAPALVFDAAGFVTADNKWKEGAKIVGGVVGGGIGSTGGPLGAAAGAYAGSKGGELLYEHRHDIMRGFGEAVTSGYGSRRNDATVRRMMLSH